jgi:NAD(P) transhydrogenase subunit alpha
MSLSNAISAIAVVGRHSAHRRKRRVSIIRWLGFAAAIAATINVVSGYLITDRMLKMFRKREPEK